MIKANRHDVSKRQASGRFQVLGAALSSVPLPFRVLKGTGKPLHLLLQQSNLVILSLLCLLADLVPLIIEKARDDRAHFLLHLRADLASFDAPVQKASEALLELHYARVGNGELVC